MPAPDAATRQRRVQQRALDTRERLFEATVRVLAEGGYANFSTLAVGEAAGVARGRLVHHFPTRTALIESTLGYILDAYEKIAPKHVRELRDTPPGERVARGLDLMWGLKTTPEYLACLVLVIGTRTDPELRDAVAAFEQRMNSILDQSVRSLVGDVLADQPDFAASRMTAIQAMRGLLLTSTARGDGLTREWEVMRSRLVLLFAPFAVGR